MAHHEVFSSEISSVSDQTFNYIIIIFVLIVIRRQEEITAEKEEIDRQKKLLLKKRPSNNEGGGGRGKRTASAAPSTPQPPPLHNGTDAPTFLKPDPLPSMTWQEYYEADEILKVRLLSFQLGPSLSFVFVDRWLLSLLANK